MALLDTGWKARGACKGLQDVMFADTEAGVRVAKAICDGCEVREDCLAYALDGREDYGVWGGLAASERRTLRRGPRTEGTNAKCGTRSGYVTHRHRKEEPCSSCLEANRRYVAERRAVDRAINRNNSNKQRSSK